MFKKMFEEARTFYSPRSDVMLMLCARSGLASKHGIGMANGVGIVDADYRGEICVPLINQSDVPFTVTDGLRIAQMIVVPVILPEIAESDELPDTSRGSGGRRGGAGGVGAGWRRYRKSL